MIYKLVLYHKDYFCFNYRVICSKFTMRFPISSKKSLEYLEDGDNIYFRKSNDEERPLRLRPEQTCQLFNYLSTIEDDAEEYWSVMKLRGDEREFKCFLGWNKK